MVFDDFNDNSINTSVWTTSTPSGTITESSGTLNISATNGVNAERPNNPKITTPIWLVDDDDLEVVVKITNVTFTNRAMMGIVLYKDSNNYYHFGVGTDVDSESLWIEKEVNGSFTTYYSEKISSSHPIWLKIRKVDNTYYFDYSTDGTSYTNFDSFASLGFTPESVGLFGSNWYNSQAFSVSFDDFYCTLTSTPIPAIIVVNEENYTDWLWQADLEITGSPSGQLSNYCVNITIPYDNEFMRYDFGDIRFGTDYGQNLHYFLRRKVDGDYAEFIVKIPVIPASPDTVNIYVYAGNDQAQDRSDGLNTFTFFDHFTEDYTPVLDTSKWTVSSSFTQPLEDSILTVNDQGPLMTTKVTGKTAFAEGYIMGARVQFNSPHPLGTGNSAYIGLVNGTDYIKEAQTGFDTLQLKVNNGGSEEVGDNHISTYPLDTYHVFEIAYQSSIKENINFGSNINSAKTISASLYPEFCVTSYNDIQDMEVDYIYIREAIGNEPSIGELGVWGTTTHADTYQTLLEIPFYHDSQALLCIRPLHEDFQATLNITGHEAQLVQALLNITGYSTHNMVQLTQALLEINEDAGNLDSQALIRIGNVYTGTLEIKGKILYKSGQTPPENIAPGTKTVTKEEENMKFVINLGGRIYG
jgi:hypothetical protein